MLEKKLTKSKNRNATGVDKEKVFVPSISRFEETQDTKEIELTEEVTVKKMSKAWLWTLIIAFVIGTGSSWWVYNINYKLQQSYELADGGRGTKVSVHYKFYVYPKVLVLDVKTFGEDECVASMLGNIKRLSKELRDKEFDCVILENKGKSKLKLNGSYFSSMADYGDETGDMCNMIREFPSKVTTLDGMTLYKEREKNENVFAELMELGNDSKNIVNLFEKWLDIEVKSGMEDTDTTTDIPDYSTDDTSYDADTPTDTTEYDAPTDTDYSTDEYVEGD